MDYKNIYTLISIWAGCDTQYWTAIDILTSVQQLTSTELALVNEGLSPNSRLLVEMKMDLLKKTCLGSEFTIELVSVDNTKPDVSKGQAVYQLPENSVLDNQIIGLDNAVKGSMVILHWVSDTNHSLIESDGIFNLAGTFIPAKDNKLALIVNEKNTYTELYRSE